MHVENTCAIYCNSFLTLLCSSQKVEVYIVGMLMYLSSIGRLISFEIVKFDPKFQHKFVSVGVPSESVISRISIPHSGSDKGEVA